MPDVTQFNDEKEWMAACVPKMMDEGREQDQAVAACMTMWREKKSIDIKAASNDPKDYLIVEDKEKPTTWHLQVRVNGKPDHGLMGAAWAALHEGYRGNKYEGPNKQDAIDKLKKMYESEKLPVPGKSIDLEVVLDELKIGARNSRTDAQRLQMIHDYSVENGAQCNPDNPMMNKSIDAETLVTYGDSVKALGDGKIGGYLVKFSSDQSPDLSGDFFTSETDFGELGSVGVYIHHGQPIKTKEGDIEIKSKIGKAKLTKDNIGIYAEAWLSLREAYEKFVYEMAQQGKAFWSSGALSHLVERIPVGKAFWLKTWILGEASLTPTPAEPTNQAVPIKSLTTQPLTIEATPEAAQDNRSAEPDHGAADTLKSTRQEKLGETDMSEETLNEIKALLTAQADKINALETVIKTAPPISTVPAASVQVVVDEADRPFKSIAANCAAIKAYEVSKGRVLHPRLTNPALKVNGASEAVPEDGGYLLEPTLAAEFLAPTHEVGQFSAAVRRLPVGSNSNSGWINGVNETDRATGSRWGGIRGYRLAEAADLTGSRPKFRRINWELKKYGVYVYGTDELLADAQQFSAVVRQGVSEELVFMLNDDILNGDGAGGPFGILSAACLVSVGKETNQAADTILTTNLSKMWMRLLPRSKANAAWFVNADVMPQLDEMTIPAGTAAVEPRFVTYNANGIMSIKGRPVYETEFNATVGDKGDIVLADMTQYLLWEKGGVQEAQSIHVAFVSDETVFRFIYRCDGQPALNAALTPYKGSNTKSTFVTLDARA